MNPNDPLHSIDPQDEVMLRRALAPKRAPADLTDQILDAVQAELAPAKQSILATIGGRLLMLRRLAAMFILAAMIGAAYWALSVEPDAVAEPDVWPQFEQEIALLAATSEFEQELDALQAAIGLAEADVESGGELNWWNDDGIKHNDS